MKENIKNEWIPTHGKRGEGVELLHEGNLTEVKNEQDNKRNGLHK